MRKSCVLSIIITLLMAAVAQAAPPWQDVQNVFGRKGTVKDNVLTIDYPRSDLNVSVQGIRIDPDLATTAMINFQTIGGRNALMTSEFVLLDTEVPRVAEKLEQNGLVVAAIHNHMLYETPRVLFLHASGKGDAIRMSRTLVGALQLTATPMGPAPAKQPSRANWSSVESILGTKGQASGDVLQTSIRTKDRIQMDKVKMEPELDPAHDINFQMLSAGRAAGAGEIACTTDQISTAMKLLQNQGITVTAVHNHFVGENPRLMYIHCWTVGNPETIARNVRSVLDKVGAPKKS